MSSDSQLTCQGYSPVSVLCPPTILVLFDPLLGRPQSYKTIKKDIMTHVVCCMYLQQTLEFASF